MDLTTSANGKKILKAKLVFDLGNSGSRIAVITGDKGFRFNLPNTFAEMKPNESVPARYQNDKTTVLCYNETHFANGAIVPREYATTHIAPSTARNKTDNLTTHLTLRLAFYRAVKIVLSAYGMLADQAEVDFDVLVLLPPLEQKDKSSVMKELIKEIKEVHVISPREEKYNFEVSKVVVEGEAIAAFFGAMFFESGCKDFSQTVNKDKDINNGDVITIDSGSTVEMEEVAENLIFHDGYVLVIDIGAGTTDLALFLDMELVDNSKETHKTGGVKVQSTLKRLLRSFLGYAVHDVQMAVESGIQLEGNYRHDVSASLTEAKREYSIEVRKLLDEYLSILGVSPRLLKGLLVVGGGSLPTVRYQSVEIDETTKAPKYMFACNEGTIEELTAKYGGEFKEEEVSPPMAKILIEHLLEISPRLLEVSVPKGANRDLNVNGAYYMIKYND